MAVSQFIDLANAPERSDEEVYNEFVKSRDRELLGVLFRRYMVLVFGVCLKYLREKHEAQDATMEIFERLLVHHPTREVERFKPYLYVVAKNYCLMKQRGEKNIHIQISEADMESALFVHPIDEQDPKEEALKKCMKKLKDLQKACIDSFYVNKKSYLEISRELKVTLSAVKSHIQNGKRNLKLCIEGEA